MKKPFQGITLLFLTLTLTATALHAQKDSGDRAAVEATLRNYLDGATYGDTTRLDAAFHPSATMKFVDAKTGEFRDVPIAQFLANARKNAGKVLDRKSQIVHIDIMGTAAQAKLVIEGETVIFHDYMNLLKIDGEWKIVSKIFFREEKEG